MPDTHSPPQARMADPQAAPGPRSRTRRHTRRTPPDVSFEESRRSGRAPRRAAPRRPAMRPSAGPKIWAAPRGPVNGASTSTAPISRAPRSRGSPDSAAHPSRAAAPYGMANPASSRPVTPIAASIPAPASVVAVPPSADDQFGAPRSRRPWRSAPPRPMRWRAAGHVRPGSADADRLLGRSPRMPVPPPPAPTR